MKKTLLLNYFKAATSCNPRKNTTRFNGLLAMFVMVMGMEVSWGQTLVAAWTFDSTADVPSTPSSLAANLGALAATSYLYADGTNGSSTWITATTGNELRIFGGTVNNDPRTTQIAGNAYSLIGGTNSSANNKKITFKFSMSEFKDPILTFATRGTSTGFNTHTWEYSTDNINYTAISVTNTANTSSTWSTKSIDFSAVNTLDNAATVYIRLTVSGATNATGNNRLDNIQINATPTSSTWNGTTWSNETPTSTVDAIINGDYTETADISCKDLTINSGKTLTIGAANSLTVAGNLVNNGTLIFKSTSAGTARFASYSGAAITSSNVTVERYLPAKRAWRLLTAPLKGSSSNTVAANWQGTANEGLLLFSPATYQSTAMTGYTTGGGSPNIWNYDNGWQKITNISTETMFNTNNSDTKAYLVFATGPHGSSTIANTTTALATTLKPVGQLITGSVAHSLTANQFKLLPNPYASPLNTAGLVTSNSGTTIWMVDPTLNTFGGYFAYDGTNWTPTTPSASDAYIQSGQGFFVKNAANTTFTIAESHKVSGNSNTWFERTTTDTSVDKIRVLLYKQDNSAWQLADGVLAVNSASGNHEVDAADADKMTNFNENLLFKNGTSNLAIEYRGLPAAGTLQPMQLSGTSAQSYELRIKTENYSNSNLTPYLENTQTGVLTAIPTDGSEVIVPFTGIAATSVAPDSRFRIVYQAPLSADDLNNLVVGVYPNPVHESLFTIELANTNAPARYSLTNLLGQVVQEGSLVSLTNAIPVHDLSEGMYLLQINQEGKRFTTKLMIK